MDSELELLIERSKEVTVSDADLEEGRIAIAAANGALTDGRITIDTMRAVRTVMLAAYGKREGNDMNMDTETKALLDKVFGPRLRPEFAKSTGLRSVLSVVLADEGISELHSMAVTVLIRATLCNGLGEIPFGWSFSPTTAAQHELAVWVLDGVRDEMTKQLDEAQAQGMGYAEWLARKAQDMGSEKEAKDV